MIPEEVKEIAHQIGQFFLEKNELDYKAACAEIERMRINRLSIIDEGTIEVELSRPGLIIGRRGELIDKLSKYLKKKIKIVETKETLLDYLLPFNWQAELF